MLPKPARCDTDRKEKEKRKFHSLLGSYIPTRRRHVFCPDQGSIVLASYCGPVACAAPAFRIGRWRDRERGTLLSNLNVTTGTGEDEMNDIFSGTSGLVAIPGSKFAWDDVCLHELIQAQVVRTPDAPAVRYAERSLTYRALNRWANRVAHELQQAGIGPDRCVGVCVERSVELVVALLATLKAGGAYLPLDPNYPRERLSFIVGDAETGAIITTNGLRRQLGLEAPHVVLLDGEPDTSASDDTAPESDVTPKHLAYNIYTSGSTGLPKAL
jgi:non-ribosomal peptide synthetase component F